MSDPSPARFETYSRREVELCNLVATRRPVFQPEDDGTATPLRLEPRGGTIGPSTTIRLGAPDARIWMEVGAELSHRLCARWAGEVSTGALPQKLAQAVRAAAFTPLLEWFGELMGTEVGFLDGEDPIPLQAASLSLWSNGEPGTAMALLHLDEVAAANLAAGLEQRPVLSPRTDPSRLRVAFQVEVGRCRITADEASGLAYGDVLLMASGLGATDGHVLLLQSGHPLATARLEGHSIIIQRLLEGPMSDIEQTEVDAEEDASDDSLDDSSQAAEPTPDGPDGTSAAADEGTPVSSLDPDQLNVELTFDLGQVSVPLSELNRIQAGYTIELDMLASGTVRILSSSRPIGQGELVQVDDRLGVRVTKLWNSSGG